MCYRRTSSYASRARISGDSGGRLEWQAGIDPILLALRVLADIRVAHRAQLVGYDFRVAAGRVWARLIRYFVTVAQEGNVTRAAELLHISQPSLSAAIQQLERQLGVELLVRLGRRVEITPAGELLRERGQELLQQADALVEEIRERDDAHAGRLTLGLTPTARFRIGQHLLVACTTQVPAVMLYTAEDTTGALLRDLARGRLDLAITFCAPDPPAGIELLLLHDEAAIVHLRSDHPLANRERLSLEDLHDETILVGATDDSRGFSHQVLSGFHAVGITPRTLADPYPDFGLQAVREGLGIVIYPRSAFADELSGSAFVPLMPPLEMPFHLAYRAPPRTAVRSVLQVAHTLRAAKKLERS